MCYTLISHAPWMFVAKVRKSLCAIAVFVSPQGGIVRNPILIFSLCVSVCGCSLFKAASKESLAPIRGAQSYGEVASGYTYVPIDPFAVQTADGDSCKGNSAQTVSLLDALPDNAVRMLIESF